MGSAAVWRPMVGQVQLAADGLPQQFIDPLPECFQPGKLHHAVPVDHFQQFAAQPGVFGVVHHPVRRDLLQRCRPASSKLCPRQPPGHAQPAIAAGVILHRRRRQFRLADGLFQLLQLPPRLVVFRLDFRAFRLRHFCGEGRVAEEKEGMVMHARLTQHPVEDLQLGDAPAGGVLQESVSGRRVAVNDLGHITIARAEDAEEERLAVADLLQAQLQRLVIVRLLLRHPPAQVDIHQMHLICRQILAQRRKDHLHQVIPLRLHVAEGGGDKYPHLAPGG